MKRISIDTSMKTEIDVNRYNNLFVGLELEGGANNSHDVLVKLAETFSVPRDCKAGTKQDKKIATTSNGETIEFSRQRSLYCEPEFNQNNTYGSVVAVYNDGSVPIEVVTRPFHICELDKKTRGIHQTMQDEGVDLWYGGQAGCHFTFLLGSHKYDSEFDQLVVKNLIQLGRLFYSDIVRGTAMGENNKTRPTNYRQINSKAEVDTMYCDKYRFLTIRKEAGKIWAVEIRCPDGTNNFDKLMETAKFYSALVRFSAHISQYGLIRIDQDCFNSQRMFSDKFLRRCPTGRKTPVFKALMRQLRPFYKILNLNSSKEPEEKYAKLFELLLSGASLREIQAEMPSEFNSLNQIQRKYTNVCENK